MNTEKMNALCTKLNNNDFIEKMKKIYAAGVKPNVEILGYELTPTSGEWIRRFGESNVKGFMYILGEYVTESNSFEIDDVKFDLNLMHEEASGEI